MEKNNLEIFYDDEADLLEIFLGKPTQCYFDEIDEDIFEGREEGTNNLIGFKIFNFKKRGGMKGIKLQLPAHIIIEGV